MTTTTYRIRVLSNADSQWVERSFRSAMEFPITRAKKLYGQNSKRSLASTYRDWKKLLNRQNRGCGGPYSDSVRKILRSHRVSARTADRITTLLALHLSIFVKSWVTPRQQDLADAPDRLAAGFQFAYDRIFGPGSLFQQMDASCGPTGMAMISHAQALGQPGLPTRVGPFPRELPWKAMHKRTVVSWIEGRRVPHQGWFYRHGGVSRPAVSVPLLATSSLPEATATNSRKQYPWADRVSFGDIQVYQWARTLCHCVNDVMRAERWSRTRAMMVMVRVLSVRPDFLFTH